MSAEISAAASSAEKHCEWTYGPLDPAKRSRWIKLRQQIDAGDVEQKDLLDLSADVATDEDGIDALSKGKNRANQYGSDQTQLVSFLFNPGILPFSYGS